MAANRDGVLASEPALGDKSAYDPARGAPRPRSRWRSALSRPASSWARPDGASPTEAASRGCNSRRVDGLGSLASYLPTWVAMMAGMMLPSATPMVRAHAAVERRKRQLGRDARLGATAAFVVGYLLVWTVFGLVAYGLYELVGAFDLEVLMWDHGGRYVAAGVIAVAAVYQLTPVKDVCLEMPQPARVRGRIVA